MLIPHEYILQKFYQYAGYPKFKKISNTFIAGCPICREGKSWGKKRRCVYLVDENKICCHNCGWYSDPIKWIQEVSNLNFNEIVDESKSFDILPLEALEKKVNTTTKPIPEKLPKDSINILDKNQIVYYYDQKDVQEALGLAEKRRLTTAINKPDTLWVSLKDKTHKRRLVIPFYDLKNEIIFYQSRAIYNEDLKFYPKYLSKINGEKSLYNINKISSNLDYIFIFEGPIDSFFVQNGTAVAGIQENSHTMFSPLQEEQISAFKLHKKIWVLDSQWKDSASLKKTQKLIDSNQTVFIWPEDIGKQYKDINEMVIDKKLNYVEPDFFIKNSFDGIKAKLLLTSICR